MDRQFNVAILEPTISNKIIVLKNSKPWVAGSNPARHTNKIKGLSVGRPFNYVNMVTLLVTVA